MASSRKPRSGRNADTGRHVAAEERPIQPAAWSSSRSVRAGLFVILGLAAFLRFYHLTTVPAGIQVDEAMNGSNILQILETGSFHVFYPENMGREGLYLNLQAIFSYFLGNEPWVLRAVGAMFGVLTVWATYLLATELFSTAMGLLASFFVAISFWHLMLSRLGTRAVAAPFFLTLAVYLLLISMKRLREGKPFLGWVVLTGAVYGLGFHTYTAFRVTPALMGVILLYFFAVARREGWLGNFWKACAALIGTAAVVVTPLLLYFIQNPSAVVGRASQISVFHRAQNPALEILLNIGKTAQMFFVAGDANWRHNYDGQREVYWPVAILFAVGIGIAVAAMWRAIRHRSVEQTPFSYAMLLIWIAVAAIPAVLSGEGVPHAPRCVLMIPAVFTLAAVGAQRAWIRLAQAVPGKWPVAVAAIFVALVTYDPYHTYFDLWANHSEVPGHFSVSLVRLADQFNRMPRDVPHYLAVTSTGPSANGIPVLMQPFTYLTRSYTQKEQQETNIHYLTPETFKPPPGIAANGKTFCQQVYDAMPGAAVTCVNLRY